LRTSTDRILTTHVGSLPRSEAVTRGVFAEADLPDDKVLVPGVIDTTTHFVEHPELIAQRIGRFAAIVGRERVMAGTDCGFSTFAGYAGVDPEIAYAKLASLVQGAVLASQRLW